MEYQATRNAKYSKEFFTRTLLLFITLVITRSAWATPMPGGNTTWLVGPDRALKVPSKAAMVARSGDTVEIDPAVYNNDYAVWHQDNLTLRATRGMAHLRSTGLIPNGKAIWIITGNNVTVENIEFSGARVSDTNGSGIRDESKNLKLRNTYFHDNEFSILTDNDNEATLVIEDSRFWRQRRKDTYSHGMYIGALKKFTLSGSHIKGTSRGHQIKTRALENHILYNRIEDVPQGNSSRLIDFSNCGLSFVIGNDLHQAATTQNIDAIGYGPEGCEGRSEHQKQLYVVNNTFVNEAWNSALVRNHAAGHTLVANNLTFGRVRFLLGRGSKSHNVTVNLHHWQPGSWLPPTGTSTVDGALELSYVEDVLLRPVRVFSYPAGTAERKVIGTLDIGSREWAPTPDQ